MGTQFTSDGLRLADGSTIPVYAGEFHYWRAKPSSWRASLRALKTLGLNIVSTAVPWSVHEQSKGSFDFSGSKDLGGFLDLVRDEGLYAILRPGPHCHAQLTHHGFPQRVLSNTAVQARTSRGSSLWLPSPPHMFPVPSYASSEFQAEVQEWFAAFAQVVVPRTHGNGAVVAIALDSQMQFFWRMAAFEGDYHPEALAWWKEFSQGVDAPHHYEPSDMPRVLQWLRFKEEYIHRSLQWIRQAMNQVGMGELACFHNLPPSNPALCNAPSVEQAIEGVAGMDLSEIGATPDRSRQRAIYLSSGPSLPFATQLGVGGPPWFPAKTEALQRELILSALAGGVRAFALYMLVERERWHGAALSEDAQTNSACEWLGPLLKSLRKIHFHTLRRRAPLAIVISRAEARAAVASCALHSATHTVTDLMGLGEAGHAELATDPSGRDYPRLLQALVAALDYAEVPFRLLDEALLHTVDAETKALILPTLRRVDSGAWAALHLLSATGTQVILGPERPLEDEEGKGLGADAVLPAGAGIIPAAVFADREELASALLELAGELSDFWIAPADDAVHCSVFTDAQGQAKALFVCNRGKSAKLASVNVPDGASLCDGISAEVLPEEQGVAKVALAPQQVRFFVL